MDLLRIAARIACDGCQPEQAKAPGRPTRQEFVQALIDRMEGIDLEMARIRSMIAELLAVDGTTAAVYEGSCLKDFLEKLEQELRVAKGRRHECEVLFLRIRHEPKNDRLLSLPIP